MKSFFPTRIAPSIALLLISADGRKWQSVIDKNVYLTADIDLYRLQIPIEKDPFFFGDSLLNAETKSPSPSPAPIHQKLVTFSPTLSPTRFPSTSPSMIPSDAPSLLPSLSPSLYPTLSPTGPTASPTLREMNVNGNGGCHPGTYLYQVNMYDSYGNGWDGKTKLQIVGLEDMYGTSVSGNITTKTTTVSDGNMTIVITETIDLHSHTTLSNQTNGTQDQPLGLIFSGNLQKGTHASAYVCLLPRRCYQVSIAGGGWLEEDSWDIRPVHLGLDVQALPPLVDGGAPSYCKFSIADNTTGKVDSWCPIVCGNGTVAPSPTQPPQNFSSHGLVAQTSNVTNATNAASAAMKNATSSLT